MTDDTGKNGEQAAATDDAKTGDVAVTGDAQQIDLSPADDLTKRLEEIQKTADGFKDQLLRKAAEFENYKRRTDTEFASMIRSANEGILNALIPVLEDFARSLKAARDPGNGGALFQGVELIYQKLTKVLEQQGLVPFESTGRSFDVSYHDALLQMPRTDIPPGTVIEEVERGYMLHDKVLRHAKVIVSAAAGPEGPSGLKTGKETADA